MSGVLGLGKDGDTESMILVCRQSCVNVMIAIVKALLSLDKFEQVHQLLHLFKS
jgi:hypothetical protein